MLSAKFTKVNKLIGYLCLLVEKKKTGEYLAAKVVSLFNPHCNFLTLGLNHEFNLGKSSQNAKTHHALLGIKTDPQDARENLCAFPSLRWRRED